MFTLQVGPEHEGQYQCQPFNKRGSEGKSPPIQVIIKDPPTLLNRPNAEYIKNIGGSVSFSCLAAGTPKPEIRWRRVSLRIDYVLRPRLPNTTVLASKYNPVVVESTCL